MKKFNIQTVAVDMQSKIDSATVLYDLAIRDKMENVSDSIILKKYSNQIILLEKEAQEILVTANNAGKRGEISQQDYDELINLVLMDSIQCKIHTLERLGLKFQ